jgi:CIC family chloride channel protein
MTAIIIIFELTNDYKIILPLMLSSIVASFMTLGIHKESIYTMKLKRRGILFKEGKEVNILRSLLAKDFISQDYHVFMNTDNVEKIIDQAIGGKYHTFQLDFADTLEQAMEIFGRKDVAEIAVLKDKQLIGVVKRKDVIEAYNHEIAKREAASGLVQKLKFTHETKTIDIGKGYRIMEIDAPYSFWDKSLKELNLKALYRTDVLLIKRKFPPQTITLPSADEIIRKEDVLVLAGLAENIKKITKSDSVAR